MPRPLQAWEQPALALLRAMLVVVGLMALGLPFILAARWAGLVP